MVVVVTHQAEKIWTYDRTTVRLTTQGASFNMHGQLNCYSTLLGTINVETSSNSIPIDFSRSKLSTTGGH